MGSMEILLDDVRAVKVDGNRVARVRFRVVGLNDSTVGILFSEVRSKSKAWDEIAEGPSQGIGMLVEVARAELEKVINGKRSRWFEYIAVGGASGPGSEWFAEVIFESRPESPRTKGTSNVIAFKPAVKEIPPTGWATAVRKILPVTTGKALFGFNFSRHSFESGQKVCPSTFGLGTGLPQDLVCTVYRHIEPHDVLIEINKKDRICPATWFRLYSPTIKEKGGKTTSNEAGEVKPSPFQKFAIADMVGFDAYSCGLGAPPKGKIVAVVTPDEDPLSILDDLLPDWRETHTLISPPARLLASANTYRYWIVGELTEQPARGRRLRPRLLLKREDWLSPIENGG